MQEYLVRFLSLLFLIFVTKCNSSLDVEFIKQLEPFITAIEHANSTGRQVGLPANPLKPVQDRIPCDCNNGICKCCTASILQTVGLKGCVEILYRPEEFSFELRMKMNNLVLYKSKVSGQNPPPICVRPPRYNIMKMCVKFHDIYFFGRNMHLCLDVGGFFQGFEIYNRPFDCLNLGDKGVKIVKPEEGFPVKPTDIEVDEGDYDEIEDYDENVVRRNN